MLDALNPVQLDAVRCTDGPLLILSGAGSGKTRVITHRIAHLILEKGVSASRIMALTFTNKAAGEMKERVEKLLGGAMRSMWIGTFHAISARILRREGHWIGYERDFVIYDTSDQLTVIREAMSNLMISEDRCPPKSARSRISHAKNGYADPEAFLSSGSGPFAEDVVKIYRAYQQILRGRNAMDFDDILVNVVALFQQHAGVLETYQDRFQYLLVDEYQDTNHLQYLLTKLLAARQRNLCVVGDDDQSIYQWRGADITNILNFERDYPEAEVIRLEQNYRSTQTILKAAAAVVKHNRTRKEKNLWTENNAGKPISVLQGVDERDEARRVLSAIEKERAEDHRGFGDFSLLYRTNAQSRALEDELRKAGIPYTIIGGLRFYERREIKDVLAYLKLVANPKNELSLRRIVNVPKRGIGDATMLKVQDFAIEKKIGLYDALSRAEEIQGLSGAMAKHLKTFHQRIEAFRKQKTERSVDQLAQEIVAGVGYIEDLQKDRSDEGQTRVENVRELLLAMEEFVERSEDASLEAFLSEVSLFTDIDTWDEERDVVTLMTLHSAKGLEFPVVFITGLEDGLFPIIRSDGESDLEEERRLFYVGITRARQRLYLCYARQRRRWGSLGYGADPSRFLREIPKELLEYETPQSDEDRPLQPRFGRTQNAPQRRKVRKEKQGIAPSGKADGTSSGDSVRYVPLEDGTFPFDVGSWVIHPSFGRGQVVEKSGLGASTRLVVRFGDGRKKRLMAKYAHLEAG
ncbi:MAG: UvrD-helicase domain-containing protein [Candidatus Latescibacteria bacterium]|nr:UvrD-helicase domain-containing protein [Candidatus Latescibacterota bacterium]